MFSCLFCVETCDGAASVARFDDLTVDVEREVQGRPGKRVGRAALILEHNSIQPKFSLFIAYFGLGERCQLPAEALRSCSSNNLTSCTGGRYHQDTEAAIRYRHNAVVRLVSRNVINLLRLHRFNISLGIKTKSFHLTSLKRWKLKQTD